jgi:hypothetical protein
MLDCAWHSSSPLLRFSMSASSTRRIAARPMRREPIGVLLAAARV